MKNLKESLRKPEKIDKVWTIVNIFDYIFAKKDFDIAGIDFITKQEDICRIISITSDGKVETKRTTKINFPFRFTSCITLHLDRHNYGIARTIMLVKIPEGPIEVYQAYRRGRFNKFVVEGRYLKGLKLKLTKLKEAT